MICKQCGATMQELGAAVSIDNGKAKAILYGCGSCRVAYWGEPEDEGGVEE